MKYTVKPTARFQKDLKRVQKRGYNISLLTDIIKKLANGEQLSEKNKDYALIGDFVGCRECHIMPNWLLIYEIDNGELILYLTRTGTHSDLFRYLISVDFNVPVIYYGKGCFGKYGQRQME